MKKFKYLLANGCSFSVGGCMYEKIELLNDPTKQRRNRFSKKLSEKLNCEEINIAHGGVSNDRIFRTTFDWIENNKKAVGDKLYFQKSKPPNKILFKLEFRGLTDGKRGLFRIHDDNDKEVMKTIRTKVGDDFKFDEDITLSNLAPMFGLSSSANQYLKVKTGDNEYTTLNKDENIKKAEYRLKNPEANKKKAPVAKKQTKKQTKKVVKKTKKNTTKKNTTKQEKIKNCILNEKGTRCKETEDEEQDDENCYRNENDNCARKKKAKPPKAKKEKPKPKKKEKKNKSCEELIADMKKFVTENGSLEHIDKSKNEYNDFLQCVEMFSALCVTNLINNVIRCSPG